MRMLILLAVTVVLLLCGCAGPRIKLISIPSGAHIEELGTKKYAGQSPVTVEYKIPERTTTSGCFFINGFKARWPSGATGQTDDRVEICRTKAGWDSTFFIDRDKSFPGIDHDVAYGRQVEMLSEEKSMAERARVEEAQYNNGYAIGNVLGIAAGRAFTSGKK